MGLEACTTACLGDSAMPFVVVGIVAVALVVLVAAYALMKRRK